ncbi:inorganic diphosphatase [Streptomonospora nanhaiensis]|uniref:Inorganic pyrophosphatase n=1 Tax=Streptomonospora nanhaiensis TaxID=1323731 RepID=A0A853BMU0_9ACTN|nr:inorganic diphosphatase [Streptomonospora nanhaiensis]MBV2366671.1 inorganic diphosphatase [Streptomonospora nanhaiensis]MBX9389976.1 inorganic diphosphatase [Streptomonospora nanhaiensis]NYI95987.1 inorganic pyrophosphatase [Streptomonospora nanhaiensis]
MELDMVVEIPQGSQNKYEMDHSVGRIRLDRHLFTSTQYPADYGYFPGTLAEDGDPLDAMVPLERRSFPGCVVRVRPVAVFWMRDEGGPDAKVLCMPAGDPRLEHVRDLRDIPELQINQIKHFFDIYKRLEPGKSSEVRGWQDRAAAEATVLDAQRRAAENPDRPVVWPGSPGHVPPPAVPR